MFTGIVEETGRVARIEPLDGGLHVTVEASVAPSLELGQSISIDGVCQTVVAVDHEASTFAVDTVEETLRKTTVGALSGGDRVNLERALQVGDRLDGHFVQGHVDTTGPIVNVEREETDWLYTIRFDPRYASFLIPVGSVTVDGISLTVARLDDDAFTVAIIPHTREVTSVGETWAEGHPVNVEFDLIGKYVARTLTADGEVPDPDRLARQWLESQ